jgi:thioredoxin reductase (NADPH)
MEKEEGKKYDIIIIGAGPAGLTAAIYSSRAGNSTLLLERGIPGGQIYLSSLVENYPGLGSTDGASLIAKMVAQAKSFGAVLLENTGVSEVDFPKKLVRTDKGEYSYKRLIIASGNRWRKLNVPGETELVGRGVSYCATCDGPFFKGKEVAVVGGGDSAVEEALYLTKFAEKVHLIHRRDKLRAEKYLQDKAFENKKIKFIWDTEIGEISGGASVESVLLKNKKSGEEGRLPVSGVFIYIGMLPNIEVFAGGLKLDSRNYIITDERMHTSEDGVYAAGDVRSSPVKQITTAASDGTIAAVSAVQELSE